MKLEELAGTIHSTAIKKTLHPKDLVFEIETRLHPNFKESYTGNGTLISSDGWVLTCKHIVDKRLHDPTRHIHLYDSGNYKYSINSVHVHDTLDLALIHVNGLETEPFSLDFASPSTNETVYMYSLVNGGASKTKGKVYIPKYLDYCEYAKAWVDFMAVKIYTKEGQSGSLFLNEEGAILGMSVCGKDFIPTKAGKNNISMGPRSDDILKFVRKVYRYQ